MSARVGSLWRNGDFLRLWGGETVSVFGSAVTMLALPLLAVTTLHASTFQVGALEAVQSLPFLLVSLYAGVVVDRRRRRGVLVTGDLGRALVLGTLPLVAALGGLGPDHRASALAQLYAVALVAGVLTVFFDVAYQSYLPVLVTRDQLPEGNAKLSTTEAVANLGGPTVAGLLVGAIGAAYAVGLDAASFVVSALAVLAIRTREPAVVAPDGGHRSIRADIAEGLRYVVRHPMLSRIAGCTGTSNLGSSCVGAVVVVFEVRQLGFSPALIGLVGSAGAVGFLLGSLVAARWSARTGLGPSIVSAALIAGLPTLVLPFLPRGQHVVAALLLAGSMFVTGIGVVVYNIGQVSLRQAITPDRLLGRMNASMRFIVWGTMPLGAVAGGVLGTALGLRVALGVGAALQVLAVMWVALSPVRSLRETPAPEPAAVVPQPDTMSQPSTQR